MGQNLTGKLVSATYEDLVQISGSVLTDGLGNDINNITVTSSFASQAGSSGYATNALSSSYAVTASYAENASGVPDALVTASISDATITFTKFNSSSFDITVNNVSSSISASFASQAGTAGFASTASYVTPLVQDLVVSGSIARNSGSYNGFVIDNLTTPTASEALEHIVVISQADYNAIAIPDPNTFYIINDATGSVITGDLTVSGSLFVTGSSVFTGSATFISGLTGSLFGTASYASQAGSSGFATSASFATTASYAISSSADNLTLQQVTDNGATTTNQITASALYLTDAGATNVIAGNVEIKGTVTFVSSSTLQIGDNVIEINFNRAAGNSGILTYDTTSPFTASLLWDVVNDRWIAGPYGSESVIILASDTGSMSVASASFASQAGTAGFASQAGTAGFATTSTSASFADQAGTAGFAPTATSASWADQAGTSGFASTATSASFASQAGSSGYATNALSASFADQAGTAGFAPTATSASWADQSGTSGFAVTASFSTTASYAATALSSSYALTASYAENAGGGGFPYTGSAEISGSLRVLVDGVADGYTITSGSISGSLIDNLGTPTGSEAIKHLVYLSQTEYNALTPDDNTMYVISGSGDVVENLTISGSLVGEVQALSIVSTTASMDCSTGNFFTLQLVGGADTRIEPSNVQAGQTINLLVSTTGSATVSFPSTVKQVSGASYVPTTTTSKDVVTFISFDSTDLYLSNVKNLV